MLEDQRRGVPAERRRVGRRIRSRGCVVAAAMVGLLAAGCVALEPGGQPTTGGGGHWPPPPPPPGPDRTPPAYGASLLRVDPAAVDFGSIEVDDSADLECRLSNRGSGDAEVQSVDVDGRDLRLIADGCSRGRLFPGDTCSFRLRYTPGEPGPTSGVVSILAYDGTRRTLEVAVRGTGRASARAEVNVRLSTAAVSFGEVELGSFALSELVARNAGRQAVRFRDPAVEGREFAVRQDDCTGELLRPQRECRMVLGFTPVRRGRASGMLRLRPEGGPGNPVLSVPLTGEGREARGPDIEVNPKSLDFGRVTLGESRLREVRIANTGGGGLRLRALRAEGRGFSLSSDGCSGQTLAADRECAAAVRFAPVAAGEVQGRLVVASDDPDERTVAVDLAGTGGEARQCPVVRLKMRWERDGDPEPLVVTGLLPPGECLTYALEIKRPGRLIVCVPPGYELTAKGFEPVKGKECKVGDDPTPYARYRRLGIEAGTDVQDLTLTRRDNARKQFKLLVEFRGQGAGRAADED